MQQITQVTLENYRCFQEKQTVRLAPLTILVGENSTGKTSFLALLRALREAGSFARIGVPPSFRKPPYDLGTFREIVHARRTGRNHLEAFSAGFESSLRAQSGRRNKNFLKYHVEFRKQDVDPFPTTQRFELGSTWFELIVDSGSNTLRFGTDRGTWKMSPEKGSAMMLKFELLRLRENEVSLWPKSIKALDGSQTMPSKADSKKVHNLLRSLIGPVAPVYSSAPVRSSPQRVYDPPNLGRDPEGGHIPLHLARMRYMNRLGEWTRLKTKLEKFGRAAGLFDGLDVKLLDAEGGPFQLLIRKAGCRTKGPNRKIADVGYGVSQVLPVVTELLSRRAPAMYLLQQPEVHLHPSAQAALGSLFCALAGSLSMQLIVETHSDHLLDRVRMDVRDRRTDLSPKDVSILYFERVDLAVHIHSLRLDEMGNVLDVPKSYRQFFMDETTRSLGLGT